MVRKNKTKTEILLMILVPLLITCLSFLVIGVCISFLWNAVMPNFGLQPVSKLQGLELFLLIQLLTYSSGKKEKQVVLTNLENVNNYEPTNKYPV